MTKFDRLLRDPDEATLLDALEQAAWGEDDRVPADWGAMLDSVASRREGRTQLESFSANRRYVVVAWWTDHPGRKHVRVAAGAVDHFDRGLHYFQTDHAGLPPLWHVCPERLYRVKRGDAQPVWLGSCACGETGLPEQLGWGGECCGPCHDRREEGTPLQVADFAAILRHPWGVQGLTCYPSGGRLAVSAGYPTVRVHDLLTGGQSPCYLPGEDSEGEDYDWHGVIHPLRFSPDGNELVGAEQDESRLYRWGGKENRPLQTSVEVNPISWVTSLVFSSDNRFLACSDDVGNLHVFDRAGWKRVHFTRRASAIDFSPDGRVLAIGSRGGGVRLLDAGTWSLRGRFDTRARPHKAILFLKYVHDGERLALVTGTDDPYRSPKEWQVRLWSLSDQRELRRADVPVVSNVERTPDGRYLAWLAHGEQHSSAAVHFWDLQTWRPAGWMEWRPEERLCVITFSADGETMATGSESGFVKLWPWRRLLEGKP